MGSTLSGSYDAHDKRQMNRATIGEGTISAGSNVEQAAGRDLPLAGALNVVRWA